MNKNAFTLAETLITLVIVGVVAALTIPFIIHNIQKEKLKSQYNKAYSAVLQALEFLQAENNGHLWDNYANYSALGQQYNREGFEQDFYKYFRSVTSSHKRSSYMAKNYNKKGDYSRINSMKIINGTFGLATNINAWRIYFYIDTNTPYNGPNALGHDIFAYIISGGPAGNSHDKLIPFNDWESSSTCSRTTGGSYSCTKYVMQNICPDDPKMSYWDCLP